MNRTNYEDRISTLNNKMLQKEVLKLEKVRKNILLNCWRQKPLNLLPRFKQVLKSNKLTSHSFDVNIVKDNIKYLTGVKKVHWKKLNNSTSIIKDKKKSISLDYHIKTIAEENNRKNRLFLKKKIKEKPEILLTNSNYEKNPTESSSTFFMKTQNNNREMDKDIKFFNKNDNFLSDKENCVNIKKNFFKLSFRKKKNINKSVKKKTLIEVVDQFLDKNNSSKLENCFFYFKNEENFYEWSLLSRKNIDFENKNYKILENDKIKKKIATLSLKGLILEMKHHDYFFTIQDFKVEYMIYKKLKEIPFIKNLKKIKFFRFWNLKIKKIRFRNLNSNLEKKIYQYHPFYNKIFFNIKSLEYNIRNKFFDFSFENSILISSFLSSQKKIFDKYFQSIKIEIDLIIKDFNIQISNEIQNEKINYLNEKNKDSEKKIDNCDSAIEIGDLFRKNINFEKKIIKLYQLIKLYFEEFQMCLLEKNFIILLKEIKNLTKKTNFDDLVKDSIFKIKIIINQKRISILPLFPDIKKQFNNFFNLLISKIFKLVELKISDCFQNNNKDQETKNNFFSDLSESLKNSGLCFYKNLSKNSNLLKISNDIIKFLKNNYDRIEINLEKIINYDSYYKIKNFKENIQNKFIYQDLMQKLKEIKDMKKNLENMPTKKTDGIYIISIKTIKKYYLNKINKRLDEFKNFVPIFLLKKTKTFYNKLLKCSDLLNLEKINTVDEFLEFYKKFIHYELFLDNLNFNFSIINDFNKIFYIPNFKIKKPEDFSNLLNKSTFLKNKIYFDYKKKKDEIENQKKCFTHEFRDLIEHYLFSYSSQKNSLFCYCKEYNNKDLIPDFINKVNLNLKELIKLKTKIEDMVLCLKITGNDYLDSFDFDMPNINKIQLFFENLKSLYDKIDIIKQIFVKDLEKNNYEEFLISFEKNLKNCDFLNPQISNIINEIIQKHFSIFTFIRLSSKKRKKRIIFKNNITREDSVSKKLKKFNSKDFSDFRITELENYLKNNFS